nr:uncharacterized protein LOC109150200 [Ipomoea trifida]
MSNANNQSPAVSSIVLVSPVILQYNASSFGDHAQTSSRNHVQSASSSVESVESVSDIHQVSNLPTETAPGTSQISNQQATSTGTSSQVSDRPKRTRRPNPKYFNDAFVNVTSTHSMPSAVEPSTVAHALKQPLWRKAMEAEFTTLI